MLRQLNVIEDRACTTPWLRRCLSEALPVVHIPFGQLEACGDAWVHWYRVPEGPSRDEKLAAARAVAFLRMRCPDALIVAQTDANDVDFVVVLNQAGASIVLHRFTHADAALKQILVFCQKIPASCLSLEQRIWKNLPWGQ